MKSRQIYREIINIMLNCRNHYNGLTFDNETINKLVTLKNLNINYGF